MGARVASTYQSALHFTHRLVSATPFGPDWSGDVQGLPVILMFDF